MANNEHHVNKRNNHGKTDAINLTATSKRINDS